MAAKHGAQIRLKARNPSPAAGVRMDDRISSRPSPDSPASMPNSVPKVPMMFSFAMSPVIVPTVSSQLSPHPMGWNMTQMTSPIVASIEPSVVSFPRKLSPVS